MYQDSHHNVAFNIKTKWNWPKLLSLWDEFHKLRYELTIKYCTAVLMISIWNILKWSEITIWSFSWWERESEKEAILYADQFLEFVYNMNLNVSNCVCGGTVMPGENVNCVYLWVVGFGLIFTFFLVLTNFCFFFF